MKKQGCAIIREDRMSYDNVNNTVKDKFSELSGRIQQGSALDASLKSRSAAAAGGDFQTMLESQLNKNTLEKNGGNVRFSRHAQQRVEQRGIALTDDFLSDLNAAVSRARAKGSKDMVVIDQSGAFIVNVPNNIVVTAISGDDMKENVFTNIDSAVII